MLYNKPYKRSPTKNFCINAVDDINKISRPENLHTGRYNGQCKDGPSFQFEEEEETMKYPLWGFIELSVALHFARLTCRVLSSLQSEDRFLCALTNGRFVSQRVVLFLDLVCEVSEPCK
ncbi:hypothetical protein CEXT_191311 [Caerostris extrusa]|uniref:Uncharacterized protein n=1 Tax=Caerostris extrusa TaxID=172846 RepID=A0AAV4WKL3_CAEEX|nr:hypothetical protein CEXT_191311 [Caerostris extrusa]